MCFLVLSIVVANIMKKLIYKSTSEYKKAFFATKDVTLNSLQNEIYYRGFGVSKSYNQKYRDSQDKLEKNPLKL